MRVALDSSFLIDLERGLPSAQSVLDELDSKHEQPSVPAPVLYEVLSLAGKKSGSAAARRLLAVLGRLPLLPLDGPAARRAAEIRVELISLGEEKPHVDVLIAGIVLEAQVILVTRDQDFLEMERLVGLPVRSY
jgi:predicted nucleic acid-binding protein